MKNLKTLAKSVCKVTLLAGMVLATTMSFAQNKQKAGSGSSLSLEKGGKKIGNETFTVIGAYNSEAGLIPAKLNGKWGLYDNDGKLVLPHQYSGLYGAPDGNECWYRLGVIKVDMNGKEGIYIDKTGKEVTPDFDDIEGIRQIIGKCFFTVKKDGKYALANSEKILTPFEYGMIRPKSNNPITFNGIRKSDNKVMTLDANGQVEGAVKYNDYVCEFCGRVVTTDAQPPNDKGCKHTLSGGVHKYVKKQ